MTVYGLTPQGLSIKTLDVIRAETEALLKTAFGASVPLGDKTLLGQLNGIYSEREALVWELWQESYSSQDPNSATGVPLRSIGAITGTLPIPASSSTVTQTLTGDPATLVPAGNLIATTSNGAQFKTSADATILVQAAWATVAYVVGNRVTNASRVYQCITAGVSAAAGPTSTSLDYTDGGGVHWRYLGEGTGAVDVQAASVLTGPIVASSGDLNVIKTPVGGWDTTVNVLDATLGKATETDSQFRLRRVAELALDGSAPQDALRAQLLNISGGGVVTAATVFMNLTDVTDSNGTPPHGVQAVVQLPVGASYDQLVWDTLRLGVAAGIVTYGTSVGTSTDSQGTVQTMKFTRPSTVSIYVDVTLKYNPALPAQGGYPTDGDTEVINAIVAYGNTLLAGSDVVAVAVGAQAFKVPGVLDVPRAGSLGGTLIKTSAGPTADTTIVITPFQIASFDSSHVTIHSSAGSL